MKLRLLFLFSFALVLLFIYCDENSTENLNCSISGNVLDKTTQTPVSGVKISIAEKEVTSDASGHYQLSNIPPDSYNLKAEVENYAVFQEEISLSSGENIVNVELETFSAYCARVTSVSYQGRVYNTVAIGNQCWFKENLNVGTAIEKDEELTNNGQIEKYCYDDKSSNCNTLGALYTWDEAMQYIPMHSNQGICPEGWHIPTDAEFTTLVDFVKKNANSLKDTAGNTWRLKAHDCIGTNTSGFSALGAGLKGIQLGYLMKKDVATFWSSTESSESEAYHLGLEDRIINTYISPQKKYLGFSIRCLKD